MCDEQPELYKNMQQQLGQIYYACCCIFDLETGLFATTPGEYYV